MDTDGDGLSDGEEVDLLHTDPKVFNVIITLGPGDIDVQTKLCSTNRYKCGFEEFLQSEPPKRKIYLTSTIEVDHLWGWEGVGGYSDYSISDHHEVVTRRQDARACTQACVSVGSVESAAHYEPGTSGWPCPQETHYEASWDETPCGSNIIVHGTFQKSQDCSISNVQYVFEVGDVYSPGVAATNPVRKEYSSYWQEPDEIDPFVYFNDSSVSDTLSDEYTTEELIQNALYDLNENCDWESMEWGYAPTSACRSLSLDERTIYLSRLNYRFVLNNSSNGAVSALTWVEVYRPESGAEEVTEVHAVKFSGNGGTIHIGAGAGPTYAPLIGNAGDFLTDIPPSNGCANVAVLKVDIEVDASDTEILSNVVDGSELSAPFRMLFMRPSAAPRQRTSPLG